MENLARLFAACLLIVSVAGCRTHDFPQYAPNYREFAYVTNGGSDTVTVVDVVNVRVDRELPVGRDPVAVTENPKRNEVYVVNSGGAGTAGSISVIDAEHNSVVATIALHKQPVSIDLDADGNFAYAANSGSNTISLIDLKAREEIAQIGTREEPVAARLSPDGKSLVVANLRGNSVSVIDAGSRQVRAVLSGCPGAAGVVILPDSSKAFVPCSTGHQVMVIALASGAGQNSQPDRLEALMDVGRAPVDLALKPDGGEVFVSNSLSDSVSEIYDTTDEVGDTYMIGADPVRSLVSRDNALVYTANFHSQELTVYSIEDGKRLNVNPPLRVGDGAAAMAFSDAGHLLFVVDRVSCDVAVVRTATRSLFTLLPAGRDPNAIAVKSFTLP